jgi:hypothetical protein
MSLTQARPAAALAAPALPAAPGWSSYFSFERQGQRPRWLLLMVLTALVYMWMPVVHERAFGTERVKSATVQAVQEVLGTSLSGQAEAAVRAQVDERPPIVDGIQRMVTSMLAILVAGALLTAGCMLILAEVSAAQALAITALAFFLTTLLRVGFWAFSAVMLGLDEAAAMEWTYVASGGLSLLAGPGASHLWRTFLGAMDVYYLIALLVSVWGICSMSPRTSLLAAAFASTGWIAVVVAFRVTLSAAVGFPIL